MQAVQYYSTAFSTEPFVLLQKPFAVVRSAYYLMLASQHEEEKYRRVTVDERPQYSNQGFDFDARGNPGHTVETAVIPLSGLAKNKQAQTDLQKVINKFK